MGPLRPDVPGVPGAPGAPGASSGPDIEPRSLGADLRLGVFLFLVIVLAVLFATGEDTSFIYIDF